MPQEHCRYTDFPVAAAKRLERPGGSALPVVEVAHEIDAGGVRSPFAQHPAFRVLVKAVVQVVVDGGVEFGGEAPASDPVRGFSSHTSIGFR